MNPLIKKIITITLSLGLLVMFFVNESSVSALTETELKNQINSATARIEQLQKEIAQIGGDISATSQQRITLENEVKKIEQTRQALLKEQEVTSSKITRTSLRIEDLNNEITTKEQRISLQQAGIGEAIRLMHEYDQLTPFEMLLSEREISDFWEEIDTLQTLESSSRRRIRELKGLQNELRGVVTEQLTEKEQLELLKDDIVSQKELVEQNKKEQETLVKKTKNKEELFKQQLAVKQAQLSAFEEEIKAYESQLRFLANPNALPGRGTAPLSWPLDSIVVTQLFGAKTGPHRTYANGHSGTDFRARTPQKVYAMADGIVMGTGNTDVACAGVSFGQWITIAHTNNLVSTSAHLSLRSVEKGQKVTRGQVIGYTGNTGRSTAPHLHISLYAGVDANGNNPVEVVGAPSIACAGKTLIQPRASREAYLDPLDYLPTTTSANFKEGVF